MLYRVECRSIDGSFVPYQYCEDSELFGVVLDLLFDDNTKLVVVNKVVDGLQGFVRAFSPYTTTLGQLVDTLC